MSLNHRILQPLPHFKLSWLHKKLSCTSCTDKTCISHLNTFSYAGQARTHVFSVDKKIKYTFATFFKESHGDWLAVPHGSENGQALKKKYEVTGIPCLVVLKADGSLITKEGRNAVQTKGPAAVKEWKWLWISSATQESYHTTICSILIAFDLVWELRWDKL